MKRITPRQTRDHERRYPSVVDLRLAEFPASRRAFLRGVTALGAGAAVALLRPGVPAAGKRRSRPVHKVTLRVGAYTFRYGNYQLQRAVAQTRDHGLKRFLVNAREKKGITRAIRRVLDAHTCADLQNGKRLATMQRKVGLALAAHYRARTRRRAPAPTVVLFVGLPGDNCDGDCPAPVAICKPPTP